ncbi:MAG: ABC transporter ATP-binding protein/permease [Thermomicrobiales bacterium]|nr:ABC transporter ATP-binding protein/permease [Thermomicrobiales bacterium]MCO5226715.1 ABC transporter ATP-binding protein/permease [Thermomicrobiales bacterium]
MASTPLSVAGSSSEFTVENAPVYDRSTPLRWVVSHVLHIKGWVAFFLITAFATEFLNAMIPGYTGRAFDAVLGDVDRLGKLQTIAIALVIIVVVRAIVDFIARLCVEVIAASLQRGAREELFVSLLGKSQTFHNRQKVGDIMARATNDIRQMNWMISPGIDLILSSMIALVVPLWFMFRIDVRLLIVPAIFMVFFAITLAWYMKKLNPVSNAMRASFGVVNANLNESVHGVEVIKSTGQELPELGKFTRNARAYRDWAVKQGLVQAWYLPTLIFSVAMAIALLHGVYLQQAGEITIGQLVAYSVLWQQFGFPVHISTFSFSMVQMGMAGARRVLELINEKTELDQNTGGFVGELNGEIVFEDVTFGYEDQPVLQNVSFRAEPGETIAIVGETGSGKSTLSKLVNRIFDVDSGRILIDGRDVRDWNLDSLRSQIAVIEQDVTLFSRSIAENIAFGVGQDASREAIVQAAKDAQAHEFIVAMEQGYDTVIGERGVTLSGGQRQRLAIARALLNHPRMLMLDDSTSAIDSNTEDEIQRAMQRLLEGRTTLLITHRLSQIRWSDKVLLLKGGRIEAFGTHDELLRESKLYRRIFSHYEGMEA